MSSIRKAVQSPSKDNYLSFFEQSVGFSPRAMQKSASPSTSPSKSLAVRSATSSPVKTSPGKKMSATEIASRLSKYGKPTLEDSEEESEQSQDSASVERPEDMDESEEAEEIDDDMGNAIPDKPLLVKKSVMVSGTGNLLAQLNAKGLTSAAVAEAERRVAEATKSIVEKKPKALPRKEKEETYETSTTEEYKEEKPATVAGSGAPATLKEKLAARAAAAKAAKEAGGAPAQPATVAGSGAPGGLKEKLAARAAAARAAKEAEEAKPKAIPAKKQQQPESSSPPKKVGGRPLKAPEIENSDEDIPKGRPPLKKPAAKAPFKRVNVEGSDDEKPIRKPVATKRPVVRDDSEGSESTQEEHPKPKAGAKKAPVATKKAAVAPTKKASVAKPNVGNARTTLKDSKAALAQQIADLDDDSS